MAGDAKKELSVIVPTYAESLNVRPLCERLFKALRAEKFTAELLLVDDDSGADTVKTKALVKELASEGYPIRAYWRTKDEGSGLSSAVVKGFKIAKYDTLLCMDADLQHEPERVAS